MKKIIISAILAFSCFATYSQTVVSIVEKELTTPWDGFGYNQWGFARESDGNTFKTWDDALWTTTKERILAIKPSLVRLPLMRAWFNTDDNGKELPIGAYNWDSKYMKAYFKIMDLYKENDIKVMSGLWHAAMTGFREDEFYASDDFARLQGDLLEYLINTKGYGNIITCYAPTNEPLGCMDSYDLWNRMCKKLYAEQGKRGLPTNIILGADSWGDWIWKPAEINRNELSGYDFHNYLNDSPDDTYNQLYNRTIEPTFEKNINNIRKYDASNKSVHVSEIAPIGVPFIDWPVETAPAHCRIDTYEYALGFWDYGIQLARSGMSSGLAWGLDGFEQNKNAGMWNNAGTFGGMTLRPWYYTWQLMCRYFPSKAKILKMSEIQNRKDLRILGARIGDNDYSFAIVNRRMDGSSKTQTITLKADAGTKTFYLYEFNRNQCGNGIDLSLPFKTVQVDNLKQNGITVEVPMETGVLVTTLPPLYVSEKEPVTYLNLIFEGATNYALADQPQYGTSLNVISNPRKREPNLSEKVCQVTTSKSDNANYNLDDAHGILVPSDRVKISATNPYMNFQTYKNGLADVTIAICFEDSEKMQGYTFKTESRAWQQHQIDLSPFIDKTIKYITIFPDRKFTQSTNTDTYLSIDNITLIATANNPQPVEEVNITKYDNSISKTLNVDFEYQNSNIALALSSDILRLQITANPKTQAENVSDKCCAVTLYTADASRDADNSKISLNPFPNIQITDKTQHLFFQTYRNTILADCALEVMVSGKRVFVPFEIKERRQWTEFGIDLSQYKDEIIENIAVYPNIKYNSQNLGSYDESYYDNFVLNNNPVSGIEAVKANSYLVYSISGTLHIIGAEDCNISIFGIDGRMIYQQQNSSANFELPLDKGLYLVKVQNEVYKINN